VFNLPRCDVSFGVPVPVAMPPLSRRTDNSGTSSAWALASFLIPTIVLGITFFLALRCGLCKKVMKRVRRTKEDPEIYTLPSESGVDGASEPESQEQILNVHNFTKEGHTLTVAVVPRDILEKEPLSPMPEQPDNPFDSVDERIARRATMRREYLESELRRTQEQIVDIDSLTTRGSPTSSRMSLATKLGSPNGDDGPQDMAELLKAAGERNVMLMARIEALESQMQSAWALGLSDQPPPGYTVNA